MTPSDAERIRSVVDVSRETLSRLEQFVALFRKWSKAINLAAPSTLPEIWERHILDSVQLYALRPGPGHWIDLGSGGGFPGVVMAILLRESDGGHVDLVESNNKKASFLRQAVALTGAAGQVHA
ncbi:MAG: 16S rRNA (guanine(527)-N(7))-methyltransferase RsmG, partial [Pseudomonadota bacterium]